jgi:hypothetical protein
LTALLAAALSVAVHAEGTYNFSYRTSGEADLKPVQVFDDGDRTFLQMKGNLVPAVFVVVDGQTTMLDVHRSGQYLVVPAIARDITVSFANLSARVSYAGAGRAKTILAKNAIQKTDANPAGVTPGALQRQTAPAPSVYGAAKPSMGGDGGGEFIERDALVPFAKGKIDLSKEAAAKIVRALAGSGAVVRVVITGRDDQFYVEGLARARSIAIRDRVLATGVPLERVVLKEGIARDGDSKVVTSDIVVTWKTVSDYVSPSASSEVFIASAPTSNSIDSVRAKPELAASGRVTASVQRDAPSQQFDFKLSDKTISTAIRRWATLQNYQVVWDAPLGVDAPITGDAVMTAESLKDALEQVAADMLKKGYDLQATVHSNRVIRFTGSVK